MSSVTDTLFGWLPDLLDDALTGAMLFPIGVAVLLGAFACIDRVLPAVDSERFEGDTRLSNPWVMFGIGCLVALLTLSVSMALTVLVPIVANGYLQREDRSEEHQSELQSLMRNSSSVFCLKKTTNTII